MKFLKTLAFLSVALILLSNINTCFAATKIWVGITTNWNSALNWNPAGLPSSFDDVIIPTLPSGRNMPTIDLGTLTIKSLTINSGASLNHSGGTLLIDDVVSISGIFNQSGGTVSTKDMELENGGTYNQSTGEFQISHDLKIISGNTFAATGGRVHFIGRSGGGANYTGNVQFYEVLIDADADNNMNIDNDIIKIAGNFTNYNPNLNNNKGTVIFNGTNPQTIYSASTPPATTTTFGNLVVNNPTGVTLLSDIGVKTSLSFNSGGYLDLDGNILYVSGSEYIGSLPVELSSFSAVILENGVKLKWRTETEVSNYGFEILRSSQNDNWSLLGFVQGHGNSNSPKDYSFIDENAAAGKYSYRLKQIDTDGQFEYSKIIEVDLGSPMNYELSQNYPNPFNPSTTIRFSVSESSFINLSIYNSLGEKIEELVNEAKEPGVHTIQFNAQSAAGGLSSGMYIYRIQTNDFVQTKKMILLK